MSGEIEGSFRTLSSENIEFRKKKWSGKNESGCRPIGDMVLILIDEAVTISEGGIIIPEQILVIRQMTAETGTIAAIGEGAFYWNSTRSREFIGEAPKEGDHVIFAKYAGRVINGNDGNQYRLVIDKEIGGIATDDGFTVNVKKEVE
jgi:co-chaperonin GroES (HSP10)